MIRRWAAWLLVLVALTAMATLRLADRRKRTVRPHDNVTLNQPAPPESVSTAAGEGQ